MLRKTDPARMATVLYTTLEVVRIVGILVQPVMPGSAAKILDLLGQGVRGPRLRGHPAPGRGPGTSLPAPSPVFPKYEEPAEA